MRRLFTTLSALSLMMCLATAMLWGRSFHVWSYVSSDWETGKPELRDGYPTKRSIDIGLWRGIVSLRYCPAVPPHRGRFETVNMRDPDYLERLNRVHQENVAMQEMFRPSKKPLPGVQLFLPPLRDFLMFVPAGYFLASFVPLPATWGALRLHRVTRRKRGLCTSCSYNLTGNRSGICPECGAPTTQGPNA
jgi:hypothetical protein